MKSFVGTCLIIIALSTQALAFKVGATPDSKRTSGELCDSTDPDFEDYRYEEKIAWCLRNVDTSLKNKIFELYKVPQPCRAQYTIDHFIPLALGGNNSMSNLWPEHKQVKATRQNLEQVLYNQINRAEITQADAIKRVVYAKKNPSKAAYGIVDNCAP